MLLLVLLVWAAASLLSEGAPSKGWRLGARNRIFQDPPKESDEDAAVSAEEKAKCECNWEDNQWFHLIDDLFQVFLVPGDSRSYNISGIDGVNLEGLQDPIDARLCKGAPNVFEGSHGARSTLEFLPRSLDFIKELCFPAQLAINVLCSQVLAVDSAYARSRQHPQGIARALHLGMRRLHTVKILAKVVRDCLPHSAWPFTVDAVKDYVEAWEVWADALTAPSPRDEDLPRSGEEEFPAAAMPVFKVTFQGSAEPTAAADWRRGLPANLARCIPIAARESRCWPRAAGTLLQSCIKCCDPRFPRGQQGCFSPPWTFEACCAPPSLTEGWSEAPPSIEHAHEGGVEEALLEFKDELRAGCPATANTGNVASASMSRAKALEELASWLHQAKQKDHGVQRIFPELDLLVSTKACTGPEVEVPWFVAGLKGYPADPGPQGVDLAEQHGTICGDGVEVVGELASHSGKRVTVPCEREWERGDAPKPTHRLESYALELMRTCELTSGRCPHGMDYCEKMMGCETCCRTGADEAEWRGVGLLTGEIRTNIAHTSRDALWLHHLLKDDSSVTALQEGLQEVTHPGSFDIVLTKMAATECVNNGQCVKTGRSVIYEMEQFLMDLALSDSPLPEPRTFHAGDPNRQHVVCYEVAAQRWRPWSFSAHSAQSFRAKALKACGIEDLGLRRKIVVLRRDSFSRQWQDELALQRALKAFASTIGAELVFANLGQLSPCGQIEVLHDAMLMLGIHGADLANLVHLPQQAAVIEIGVECEAEGSSVDSPTWRGPGTVFNGSIFQDAQESWRRVNKLGKCPPAGAIMDHWLQALPLSQFGKLARQANLLYLAVMDCSNPACSDRPMGEVWDRGWCNIDIKSQQYLNIDIEGRLMPVIWSLYEDYLRHRT